MSREIELLEEIRGLLEVIAEPALAKRHENFRAAIRVLAGKNEKKARAIMLMDGSRSQSAVAREAGMDQAQVNRLVKAMTTESLVEADHKHPKLRTKLPANFFEQKRGDE